MKPVTVCVCPSCVLNGAMDLVHTAQQLLELYRSTCAPAPFSLSTAILPDGLAPGHPSPAVTVEKRPHVKVTEEFLLSYLTSLSPLE